MKEVQMNRMPASVLSLALAIAVGIHAVRASAMTIMDPAGADPTQENSGQATTSDVPYDLQFIDVMIMHYRQGVEVARIAETKAQHARVKGFASKTAADQEKEIAELQGYRDHFYAGRPKTERNQMRAIPSHMHADMNMSNLQAATGGEFDRLFLDMLMLHHQTGVNMLKEAVGKAEHAEIKEFARRIIAKRQGMAEMNRIKAMIGNKTGHKASSKSERTNHKRSGH